MMGIEERTFSPLPREVWLEDLVPRNGFFRRLEGTLDLSFVRDLARNPYARGGRPSVEPVVFFNDLVNELREGAWSPSPSGRT
jgi:hypothetical protein